MQVKTILLLAILLFTLAQARVTAAGPSDQEPWQASRISKEELRASAELASIQKRIDAGEIPKVQFDLDSERIRPETTPALDLIADLLLRNPRLKLRISAHTCILGSEAHNLDLSQRRARSVKEYLVKQGVPPPAMRYKGYGFNQPIADNSTEEGRRKNRRVEFTLVTHQWESVF